MLPVAKTTTASSSALGGSNATISNCGYFPSKLFIALRYDQVMSDRVIFYDHVKTVCRLHVYQKRSV